MTSGYFTVMERINDANNAQQIYINKIKEYQRGIQDLKSNIEKVIIPVEEAKAKAAEQIAKSTKEKQSLHVKTDADKAKEELDRPELNKLIITLTNNLQNEFGGLVNKLNELLHEGKVSAANVTKALVELHDTNKVSVNTSQKILEELTGEEELDEDEFNELRSLFGEEQFKTKREKEKSFNKRIRNQMNAITDSREKLILPSIPDSSIRTRTTSEVSSLFGNIQNNDFSGFQGINKDTDGNTYIGDVKFNIKYNDERDEVDITQPKSGDNIKFSVNGFNELFGGLNMPQLNKITKVDFINYAKLVENTNIEDITIDQDKIELLNKIKEIMKEYESKPGKPNTRLQTSTRNHKLITLYDKVTKSQPSKSSFALEGSARSGEGCSTVILPNSVKELKQQLTLIMASLNAGNNSTDMKNKASAIIDQLHKKKQITSSKEKQLLSMVFSTI